MPHGTRRRRWDEAGEVKKTGVIETEGPGTASEEVLSIRRVSALEAVGACDCTLLL